MLERIHGSLGNITKEHNAHITSSKNLPLLILLHLPLDTWTKRPFSIGRKVNPCYRGNTGPLILHPPLNQCGNSKHKPFPDLFQPFTGQLQHHPDLQKYPETILMLSSEQHLHRASVLCQSSKGHKQLGIKIKVTETVGLCNL